NIATFVCPECQKTILKDVSKYKHINKAVRVKCRCSCGHHYSVLLERRKFYRKEANLPGVFIHGPKKFRSPMTVKDLSRRGLKFQLKAGQNFQVGEKLFVEFKLDDRQQSLVKKEIVVKSMIGSSVGAEFCSMSPSDPSTQALHFYLF
ncbi:MAG: PilZ domain-containing protein, partial [Desulfobacteraceae bacterium]|nr:PilZ domain-containing protein [Desulfobacteraceae bacterium]